MGQQATAGVPDDEEYDEAESQRIGHTIGQPSVNAGMSRNLMHTNSIASQPNIPVGRLLPTFRQMLSKRVLCSGPPNLEAHWVCFLVQYLKPM